jgi:hypothetical protein
MSVADQDPSAMVDRSRRLRVASAATKLAAVLLVFGPGLVYAGAAEPYLSSPPPVFGPVDPLVIMVGGALGLRLAWPPRFLRSRYWRATAAEADLSVEEGGVVSAPTAVGTVRGRRVRARIGSNPALRTGTALDTAVRYTAVEAELREPTGEGVVIGPRDQDTLMTPYDVAAFADAETDELVAAGTTDALAEAVVADRVREALNGVESLNQVYAGDAKAVGDSMPDDERTPWGTNSGVTTQVDVAHEETAGGDWLGGPGWVSHVSRGTVLDGETLRAEIEAVVAVAEALEDATARR